MQISETTSANHRWLVQYFSGGLDIALIRVDEENYSLSNYALVFFQESSNATKRHQR